MNLLTNFYILNYIFYPIYYCYDIFIQLNKEYIDYIETTYCSNNNNSTYTTSELDFIMTKNFNSLDEIKSNTTIFVDSFYNLLNNEEYVIGLRKLSLLSKIYFLTKNLFSNPKLSSNNTQEINEMLFDDNFNKYTIYTHNKNSTNSVNTVKSIQVHLINSNTYKIINKNISVNYILISNILTYISNNEYPEITEDNYNYNDGQLFNKWIKPIEPIDTINYKKILERKINEENVKIDGLIYTDIFCYRNLIQSDYQTGLRILYPNSDSDDSIKSICMPILFTTYRVNQQGFILTILH